MLDSKPTDPRGACLWCGATEYDSWRPCTTCKAEMAKGVTLVEVDLDPDPTRLGVRLDDDRIVYPTGRWATVGVARMAEALPALQCRRGQVSFLDRAAWRAVTGDTSGPEAATTGLNPITEDL